MKLETVPIKTQIPLCMTVFGFLSKTSLFAGLGDLLGTFLFYLDVDVGVGVGVVFIKI